MTDLYPEVVAAIDTGTFVPKYGEVSFETYCKERWTFSASRARHLIGAAEVVEALNSVTTVTVLPQNEHVARPLRSLRKDPEKYREARHRW